jgi:hypothetical protein
VRVGQADKALGSGTTGHGLLGCAEVVLPRRGGGEGREGAGWGRMKAGGGLHVTQYGRASGDGMRALGGK